jgi:6-phosphofructokinase 1
MVGNIINKSGTVLYTARCDEFAKEEGMNKALQTIKDLQIDGIVALGGDGTFRGATDLTNHGIPTVGIPCTIDNDITATEYTIGFDTAMNTVLGMVDALRETCESHKRCNVIEVMGQPCGQIALTSGIATGALAIAIPEVAFDEEFAIHKIRSAREAGKRGLIAIVSEGMAPKGNDKYSEYFAKTIESRTGIETKFVRCGHIVRGGAPTLRDRLTATDMGYAAVNELLAGKSNEVMCLIDGKVVPIDINYALILDRMYKNKLKDGDLDAFTAEQIAEMKQTCEYRRQKMASLYQLSFDLAK